MGRPQEEHTFYHSIKLDNPTKAIDRLIAKIWKCGDVAVKRDLLPTMIDLQLPQNIIDSDLPGVRKLFRSFKVAQERNFIRCITSLELAATSDCVDAFYARTANHAQHVDAFCTVRSITGDYVELKVVVPFETRQNAMVRELSRLTDCSISRGGDPDDTEHQIREMYKFCRNPHASYVMGQISAPCHVVLVTNYERDEYIPIPVWGLGVEEAVRRYQVSDRGLRFLQQVHSDIFVHQAGSEDNMILLLQLIRERLEDGVRLESAPEIYALAELLIGYFMINIGNSVSNREIVMFDVAVEGQAATLISLRYAEHLQQ